MIHGTDTNQPNNRVTIIKVIVIGYNNNASIMFSIFPIIAIKLIHF
jgi:hypothetical protein